MIFEFSSLKLIKIIHTYTIFFFLNTKENEKITYTPFPQKPNKKRLIKELIPSRKYLKLEESLTSYPQKNSITKGARKLSTKHSIKIRMKSIKFHYTWWFPKDSFQFQWKSNKIQMKPTTKELPRSPFDDSQK